MAIGDRYLFDEATKTVLSGDWDMQNDVFKIGLIDNTVIAAVDDELPVYPNYTEVTGGNVWIGGKTLANITIVQDAGITKVDCDDVLFESNASNPSPFQFIVYNYTDSQKRCLLFGDLTPDGGVTPYDMTSLALNISWGTNGLFRVIAS
jgi:hypothetical protein